METKLTKGKDRFGNDYTLDSLNMREGIQITQTKRTKRFEFMRNEYSWSMLQDNELVKIYYSESHSSATLEKDKYDRLLLFFWDEEWNFDGGPDREDYLWVVVEDESDADQLVEAGKLSRLRVPFIAADENNWMSAHQYVDNYYMFDKNIILI